MKGTNDVSHSTGIMLVAILTCQSLSAQEVLTSKFAASYNRMATTLRLANQELNQPGSDLELVAEQREQLKALKEEYKKCVHEFAALSETRFMIGGAAYIVGSLFV